MTLKMIAAQLEAIEGRMSAESRIRAELERLRLDIERYVLKAEGQL